MAHCNTHQIKLRNIPINSLFCFHSDDLVCTCGATYGLMMLTCTMFKKGDYVFVEDPTYFIAIKIFQDDFGLNVIPGKV